MPPASVVAADVKNGDVIWKYERNVSKNLPVCCGVVNRRLAILGDLLFFGSIDGYLVAINAHTGKVVWQTQVAKSSDGYSMTGAPLIVKDLVVGWPGENSEFAVFLLHLTLRPGNDDGNLTQLPGPGEFGHETWTGDAWKTGGGPTWVTGSYDTSLDLLYWGVGNRSPDFSSDLYVPEIIFLPIA